MTTRRAALCIVLASLALLVSAPNALAVTFLSEGFQTDASWAQLGATYLNLTFSSGGAFWSTSGGRAVLSSGAGACLGVQQVNPFADGGYVLEGDIGIPPVSYAGNYNVGLLYGARNFTFHPGYPGGAFRIERPGFPNILENTNLGFTPAMGVLHRMQIQALGTNQYRTVITDTTNPLNNAFSITVTDPAPVSSAQTFGLRCSSIGPAFYDNLRLHVPYTSLNGLSPTDGKRVNGTTVWADSGGDKGGYRNDATFLGGTPTFAYGYQGGVGQKAWTYNFSPGTYAKIANSPTIHNENFLVEGWFQFDRVKDAGEVGPDVTLAENGDLFAGAGSTATYGSEWYWYQTGGGMYFMVFDTQAQGYYSDPYHYTVGAPLGFTESPLFHHLVAAKNGSDLYLYVDGAMKGHTTVSGFTTMNMDGTAGLSIGTYIRYGGSGGDPFDGQIGAFNLYSLSGLNISTEADLTNFVARSYQERAGDFYYWPEPTSLVLLGAGLLALARRRRV